MSATLALPLAPGAGAARSTMSGTIIHGGRGHDGTEAPRVLADHPITHPRRLAWSRLPGREGAAEYRQVRARGCCRAVVGLGGLTPVRRGVWSRPKES